MDQVVDNYSQPKLLEPQTPEEVARLVTVCKNAGVQYRQNNSGKWDEFKRKYKGDFYTRGKQGYECRVNKYHELCNLQAAILTQQQWRDYVSRVDETADDVTGDMHTKIIYDEKEKGGYYEKEFKGLLKAAKYGPMIMKTFWNRKAERGLGYGDFLLINPQNFFVNPGCHDLADAVFCGIDRAVATSELKRLYPEHAAKIKADDGLSIKEMYGQDIAFRTDTTVSDSVTGAAAYFDKLKGQNVNVGQNGEQSLVVEMYYRDPRTIIINTPEDLAAFVHKNPGFGGNNESFYQNSIKEYMDNMDFPMELPLYPHGRLICICGTVVLEDDPVPYPEVPFDVWWNNPSDDGFWEGKGQVELMSEPLANYHLISTTFSANRTLQNLPPWVTTDRSLDEIKFKQVRPNGLLYLNNGKILEPLKIPPSTTADAISAMNFRLDEAEGATNIRSILAGVRQTGMFSAKFFNEAQDSALQSMQPFVRRLMDFRKRIGKKLLWMNKVYLTAPRQITFMNDSDKEELLEINQLSVQHNPGMEPQWVKSNDTGVGNHVYRIEDGVLQPFNKLSRFNQALEISKMLQALGITEPAIKMVLESSGYPGWKAIWREIKKHFDAVQQSQADQQKLLMQREDTDKKLDVEKKAAELATKIEVARIQAQGSEKAAIDSPQVAAAAEATVELFQETIGRMMENGIPPEEILGAVAEMLNAGPGGMPPTKFAGQTPGAEEASGIPPMGTPDPSQSSAVAS